MPHAPFRERIPTVLSILILFLAPAVSFGQESVQVTAMIFETAPAIYTVTSSEPVPSGGIRGTTIGGQITSAFPPAIVRLKIGGPADFDIDAIPALIRLHFKFTCGSEISEGLPARMIGKDIFAFKDGSFVKIGHALLATGNPPVPSTDPFEFSLELLSRQEKILIFEARCTRPATEGAQEETLLKEIIGLRPSEPVLIGFPYLHRPKGKYVYWIALLLE